MSMNGTLLIRVSPTLVFHSQDKKLSRDVYSKGDDGAIWRQNSGSGRGVEEAWKVSVGGILGTMVMGEA